MGSPAERLSGIKLSNGWVIGDIVPSSGTGGFFSVSYHVENESGNKGFLKALDLQSVLTTPSDVIEAIRFLTTSFAEERELLYKCKKLGLSRVSVPLDDGYVNVDSAPPEFKRVPYIIIEMADGDVRKVLSTVLKFDLAWALRALHNTAVGVQQLHTKYIAHQDIKPSNILEFEKKGFKIGDLGRSSDEENPGIIDTVPNPGDLSYSPPEFEYTPIFDFEFEARYFLDLYLLGSLIFSFFSNCTARESLQAQVTKNIHGIITYSNFDSDKPIWMKSFNDSLRELKLDISKYSKEFSDELTQVAEELCNPDPSNRGNPKVKPSSLSQRSLQRYISIFNKLHRKAEIDIK